MNTSRPPDGHPGLLGRILDVIFPELEVSDKVLLGPRVARSDPEPEAEL